MDGIERGLREVRERFLDRLDERLDRIRRASALAPADPAVVDALKREVHSMVGAAGTLGFHDLAAAAEAVERALREQADADATAQRLAVLQACAAAYAVHRAPA